MDETTHRVTLPMSDYRDLKEKKSRAKEKTNEWKRSLSSVQDFISHLIGEVEEPDRLIEDFNKRRDDVTVERDGLDVSITIHADTDAEELQD